MTLTLERAIDSLRLQELFVGLTEIRLQALNSVAQTPLDQSDFISRHYLFCRKASNASTPVVVGGYRTVSLDACDRSRVDLPLMDILTGEKSEQVRSNITKMVQDHRTDGKPLVYSSYFVIASQFQRTRVSRAIHHLVAGLVYIDQIEKGIETALGVATAANVGFFHKIGYKDLSPTPIEIGASPSAADDVFVFALTPPSEFAKQCYESNKSAIDRRDQPPEP